jgi:hypothetical protein
METMILKKLFENPILNITKHLPNSNTKCTWKFGYNSEGGSSFNEID